MGRGAAFFHIRMRHKGTNGAIWLYFAGALCYAEGRKVGIAMWEKIKRYRTVWMPLLIAVILAEVVLLAVYHMPGTEAAINRAALTYAMSSIDELPADGEVVQRQRMGSKMVVTFRNTVVPGEFGAVLFERGWNGLWAPVAANGGTGAPVQRIDLNEESGVTAVYAVDCPEEATFWNFVDIPAPLGGTMTDTATARTIEGPAFIEFQEDFPNMRIALYDAQGKELPLELTMYDGPTGGWGKETVELELLNQIAGTILLIGIAVSAVRLRRLRRQEDAARQEDAQQNGQGQSKR